MYNQMDIVCVHSFDVAAFESCLVQLQIKL